MTSLRNRIAGTVLVAGLIATPVAAGIVDAAPAEAAVCTYSGCNGKDPHNTGCDVGAYTLESFNRAGAHIELRYSPSCKSAWAYGYSTNTWRNCTGWTDQDVLWVEGSTNRSTINLRYGRCLSAAPGYWFYTAMVGFNYWTRACLVNYAPMSSTPRYNGCTAWR